MRICYCFCWKIVKSESRIRTILIFRFKALSLFLFCQEYSVLWRRKTCSCHKSSSFLERICEQSCPLSLSLAILAMRKSARKNNRWSIRRKKFVARLIRHDMNHVPILWIIASNFPTDHRLCIFFSRKETASRINRDSTNFVLSN